MLTSWGEQLAAGVMHVVFTLGALKNASEFPGEAFSTISCNYHETVFCFSQRTHKGVPPEGYYLLNQPQLTALPINHTRQRPQSLRWFVCPFTLVYAWRGALGATSPHGWLMLTDVGDISVTVGGARVRGRGQPRLRSLRRIHVHGPMPLWILHVCAHSCNNTRDNNRQQAGNKRLADTFMLR